MFYPSQEVREREQEAAVQDEWKKLYSGLKVAPEANIENNDFKQGDQSPSLGTQKERTNHHQSPLNQKGRSDSKRSKSGNKKRKADAASESLANQIEEAVINMDEKSPIIRVDENSKRVGYKKQPTKIEEENNRRDKSKKHSPIQKESSFGPQQKLTPKTQNHKSEKSKFQQSVSPVGGVESTVSSKFSRQNTVEKKKEYNNISTPSLKHKTEENSGTSPNQNSAPTDYSQKISSLHKPRLTDIAEYPEHDDLETEAQGGDVEKGFDTHPALTTAEDHQSQHLAATASTGASISSQIPTQKTPSIFGMLLKEIKAAAPSQNDNAKQITNNMDAASKNSMARFITFKANMVGAEGEMASNQICNENSSGNGKQIKIAPLENERQLYSPTTLGQAKQYTDENQLSERKNLITPSHQDTDPVPLPLLTLTNQRSSGGTKDPGFLRMLTSAFGGGGQVVLSPNQNDKSSARGSKIMSSNRPSLFDVLPVQQVGEQLINRMDTVNPGSTKANSIGENGVNVTYDEDDDDRNDFIRLTEIDQKLIGRRSRGKNAKRWIIYPDDQFKTVWEFNTTMCILLTCILTPYYLAFPEDYVEGMIYFDLVLNSIFAIDIIVNFFTAYYDQDYQIVDNQKIIAKNYLKTWCIVDMSSIIPFDQLYQFGSINKISRFTRIGKIYKLIRMTKIVRLIKIVKVNNKLVKHLSEILKISAGTERLVYLVVSFFAIIHVTTCLWIFIAMIDDNSKVNWIYFKDYQDKENYDLYITSFYFIVTTLVTVGYGDVAAISVSEKVLCIVLMIIGVVCFSVVTGSLSSIITSYDSKEAQLKEKIATLNDISNEYRLDIDLFNKLAKTVKYDHSKKQKDTIQFMEELPHKLKLELAMVIHSRMYSNVNFFKDKEKGFIAWIAKLIRPMNIEDQDYIYKEGEEIVEIYFLVRGSCGYVLPRFENKIYLEVKQGDHFGHTDLGYEREFVEPNRNSRRFAIFDKASMVRRFTVQAFCICEVLALSVKDLLKMKLEFPKIFASLFKNVRSRLHKELALKIEIIKKHEETKVEKAQNVNNIKNVLRAKLRINLLKGLAQKFEETQVQEVDYDTPKPNLSTKSLPIHEIPKQNEQVVDQSQQEEQVINLVQQNNPLQIIKNQLTPTKQFSNPKPLPHQNTMNVRSNSQFQFSHRQKSLSTINQPFQGKLNNLAKNTTESSVDISSSQNYQPPISESRSLMNRLGGNKVTTMPIASSINNHPGRSQASEHNGDAGSKGRSNRGRVTLRMADQNEQENDSKMSSVILSEEDESSSDSNEEVDLTTKGQKSDIEIMENIENEKEKQPNNKRKLKSSFKKKSLSMEQKQEQPQIKQQQQKQRKSVHGFQFEQKLIDTSKHVSISENEIMEPSSKGESYYQNEGLRNEDDSEAEEIEEKEGSSNDDDDDDDEADYTPDEFGPRRHRPNCDCNVCELKIMMATMMNKMNKIEQRVNRVERKIAVKVNTVCQIKQSYCNKRRR